MKTTAWQRPLKLTLPPVARSKTPIHEKIGEGESLGGALTTAQAHRTAAKHHPRRIALFGGSFDPVHSGHLGVARAADRRFNFDEMHLFRLAGRPTSSNSTSRRFHIASPWSRWRALSIRISCHHWPKRERTLAGRSFTIRW